MGLGQDDPGAGTAAGAAATRRRPDAATLPAGGTSLAAGQLGGGDRALRARPEGADPAPLGDDGRGGEALRARRRGGARPGRSRATARSRACRPCSEIAWRLVVLDEAQAIKNPAAKQTRAAKALKAEARIALTGTPVENGLGDLWSIFDVINPGLLGSAKQFAAYAKRLGERAENPYGPLRELVRPYILRRMKTDRAVIADLPDKTEVTAHCHLSRRQAALYAQAVAELERGLEEAEGIAAQGARAGDADAAQADLQPPVAVAERRRLGGGRQRQAGAAARDCRGGGRAPGEDAGLHPVPRDDCAARGVPRWRVRAAGAGAARRDRGGTAPRPGAAASRTTRRRRSSCCR